MSGQQGGSVVGGLIGAVIGGLLTGGSGAALGFAIGSAIGGIAGGLLFPADVKAPDINAPQLTRASYSQPIPLLYGRMRVGSQLVWASGFSRQKKTRNKIAERWFTVHLMCTFCKGPVQEFVRVWADDLLIYDASGEYEVNAIYGAIRFFYGTETQLPDPIYELSVGVGNAPAYRGLAGVVFEDLDLREVFNRIPRIRAEIISIGGADQIIAAFYRLADYPDAWQANLTNQNLTGPMCWKFEDGVLKGFNTFGNGNSQPVYENGAFITQVDLSGDALTETQGVFPQGYDHAGGAGAWYIGTLSQTFEVYLRGSAFPTDVFVLGIVLETQAEVAHWDTVHKSGADTQNGSVGSIFMAPDWETLYVIFRKDGVNKDLRRYDAGFNQTGAIELPAGAYLGQSSLSTHTQAGFYAIEEDGVHFWVKPQGANPRAYIIDWTAGTVTLLQTIDIADVSLNQSDPPLDTVAGHATQYTGTAYDHCLYYFNSVNSSTLGFLFKVCRDREIVGTGTVSLQSIVDDICDIEELPERDTSELTDVVFGYFVNNQISGRGAIEQLMRPYYFDGGEINGVIDFQKRKVAVTRGYSESELVKKLEISVTDDRDLPREINIRYLNELYETGHQTAKRLPVKTKQTVTIDAPIRMADEDARQVAERWLFYLWTERLNYKFSLPPSSLDLNPMDIIEVTRPGETHRIRIRRLTYMAEGIIEVEGTAASAADYVPLLPAGLTTREGVPLITPPLYGPTDIVLLDIPLLANNDAVPGIYAGQSGTLTDWEGMSLFISEDDVDFTEQYATSLVTLIATADSILPDAPADQWDEINELTVTVTSHEDNQQLVSVNEDDVLFYRKNTAALGAEIIAFRDAELIGTQQYTLSGLARGLYGTEWATGGHTAGEELVLLETATLDRITAPLNALRYYKGVSFNSSLDNTASETFTNTGVAQEPYAVADLHHENLSGDFSFTWLRRSRFSPPQAFWETELAEAVERYDIEIEKAGSVVQTAQVSTSDYTYSAADQTADGVIAGDALTVRVWQVSATVGRGYVSALSLVA